MPDIAVVNSSAGSKNVSGFIDSSPLQLTVSKPGLYVVFARVVLSNDDGDAQNASARISHDEEFVMDRVDLRLPSGMRTSISLQGTLRVQGGQKQVNLLCQTWKGTAHQSSICAMEVSELRNT